jgi:predicted 3-demethylubiquinone-9 3-methyltransferase (glyoxalase superfamily)
LWDALAKDGTVMMPLDAWPFARKFGWVADRFGVSWQLSLPSKTPPAKVHPSLLFTQAAGGRAEEALRFYAGIFDGSAVGAIERYGPGREPDREGTLYRGEVRLGNQWFTAMDSAHPHAFTFTEGVSLSVACEDQREIDHFWDRLTEGGSESRCGWLKDRFGVSWQVVPRILGELMADPERAKRVTAAFLPMKKLDLATLLSA